METKHLENVRICITNPPNEEYSLQDRVTFAIRRLIVKGALQDGSTLPAPRRMARSIGVSRGTVEAAYVRLHAEGYVERRVGSGTFVSLAIDLAPPEDVDHRKSRLRTH